MKGTNKTITTPGLQRRLRNNTTDAEQRLWRYLRRKQIASFKFRRQHPFGKFVLDFVCLEAMLAVEVDGGQHAQQSVEDAERSQCLEQAGFRVLRFWNNEVLSDTDAVLQAIWRALEERGRRAK